MEIHPPVHIDNLADSLLLCVFRFLNYQDLCLGVRQTCIRWNLLSYDFTLWKELDLSNWTSLTDDVFTALLDQLHHIVGINLSNCVSLTDSAYTHVADRCPDLEKLVLSGINVSDGALLYIAKKCPRLKYLEIFPCTGLSCDCLCALPRLAELRHLRFNNASCSVSIVVADLLMNGSLPSKIEEFVLKSCTLFTEDLLLRCAETWNYLQILDLSGCQDLNDEIYEAFAKNCGNLSSVSFSDTLIGDKALRSVAMNCPRLEKLNVSCCLRITDIGLIDVATHCSQLLYLNISGSQSNEDTHQTSSHIQGNATDVAVQEIASHCPRLTYFNVSSCPSISDLGLVAIAEHCQNIRHLEISNCIAVTDKSVYSLVEHCKHLERFQASECVQLTSQCINALVKCCPKLKDLQLETCHYVGKLNFDQDSCQATDTNAWLDCCEDYDDDDPPGFQYLAGILVRMPKHSPVSQNNRSVNIQCKTTLPNPISLCVCTESRALKHINLSCCSKIADDSLRQIATHCPYLQYISLYGCYRITDKGMEYLVKGCKDLRYLNIELVRTYQSKLSDLALVDIAENCQNLEYLNIRGGVQFSRKATKAVVNSCCKLTQLRCTMEVKGDIFQDIFQPREPYKVELEGRLTWSRKYHPQYGNPVKQCHLLFHFRPSTASGRCIGRNILYNIIGTFMFGGYDKLQAILESSEAIKESGMPALHQAILLSDFYSVKEELQLVENVNITGEFPFKVLSQKYLYLNLLGINENGCCWHVERHSDNPSVCGHGLRFVQSKIF
ncbi:uncharacterized protein LOC144345570 [Saccoglossus kowalevskii]